MINEFWINLPVKDVGKSKEFFEQLGFSFKPVPGNSGDAVCLVAGSKNKDLGYGMFLARQYSLLKVH
jgi:uncharacterized protein